MLSKNRSFTLFTFINDDADVRRPSGELSHPVVNRCQWYYCEEWPVVSLLADQIGEQGDCLNSLSQTHLVRQDTVQVIVVQ